MKLFISVLQRSSIWSCTCAACDVSTTTRIDTLVNTFGWTNFWHTARPFQEYMILPVQRTEKSLYKCHICEHSWTTVIVHEQSCTANTVTSRWTNNMSSFNLTTKYIKDTRMFKIISNIKIAYYKSYVGNIVNGYNLENEMLF